MAVVIFLCAFGATAGSLWPYMVPFSVTAGAVLFAIPVPHIGAAGHAVRG